MPEVFFYHLQGRSIESTLPTLLEKSLERGWRVVVQGGSDERVSALDALLWTYRDESFLPHGPSSDRDASEYPIVLTARDEPIDAARVRFLIDGASLPQDEDRYERIVVLFDGSDEEALERAREQWREARGRGLDVTYWQQDSRGRWERRA